jgi:hypothetical protein
MMVSGLMGLMLMSTLMKRSLGCGVVSPINAGGGIGQRGGCWAKK